MRIWVSIKGLVWMLSGVLGALLLTGGLIAAGFSQMAVPSPKNTAEEFLRALAAHRYDGAVQFISEEIASAGTAEDLRALVSSFEAAYQRIDQVHSIEEESSGSTATVKVEIGFEDGTRRTLIIPLRRENGVWKVISLKPVWDMIHIVPRGKIYTI